eukprot:TRINITY_DN799_c0_g1_i1.p1 TRINITY_DN799_c0_g1~~TRINITY_DN799_c0_g1_i1.p1  ORF type:complete len:344 (+),score=47.43 TRINITY_DN799_c0_g1_i1:207-1238(+)
MARLSLVLSWVVVGLVASVLLLCSMAEARKYGIKSIKTTTSTDCDLALTKSYGDDEDGMLLIDASGNIITSQGGNNFQFSRTLPRSENNTLTSVVSWTHKVRFVVSASTGLYALGNQRTIITDVSQHLGMYHFTHLVPITNLGVDATREPIALSISIPIYIKAAPIAMVFQGREAVGLFDWSMAASSNPTFTTSGHDGSFYLIDLVTGHVTVVEEFVMSTDHCAVSYDVAAYGVLEENNAEFSVLCMGYDGLSRFNHNGGRMGYVWGPTSSLIDMHEVAVDYYRPQEASWYVGIDNHGVNDVWPKATASGNYIARCGTVEYSSAAALFNPVAALFHAFHTFLA